MNYLEMLKQSAEEHKSLVCLGMDPVLEKIPIQNKPIEETIVEFYQNILNACESTNSLPAVCKPNYAFYGQYGFDGLRALKKVIDLVKAKNIPVILDAKRGDIGKTSAAYAKEVYGFWGADCVTVAPYMGWDTVKPFIEWSVEKGKGMYVLARTSNPSAVDFQNLEFENKPLYEKVGEKIVEWGQSANGNVGAVIGATSIKELQRIHDYFTSQQQEVPYLIPGVGGQGGSAEEVMNVLRGKSRDLRIYCVNSSSGINYAYQKKNTEDYAGAAAKAVQELNQIIGFKGL
jgi:orotidine-5'-phosphate decarboxylase